MKGKKTNNLLKKGSELGFFHEWRNCWGGVTESHIFQHILIL